MVSKPLLGVRACEICGRKWVLGQVCSRDASLNRACWEGLLRTIHVLVCVWNQQPSAWAMEIHPRPCCFTGIVWWQEKPGHLS